MIDTSYKHLCLLFLVAFIAYACVTFDRLAMHSVDNHFVYQADAWLNGSLELVRKPHHQNDWASYETLELDGESKAKYGRHIQGFFVHQSKRKDHFKTLQGSDLEVPRRDITDRKKHYFVSFPPGPALLMLPFVALSGYGTNDVLFTIVCAALNCVFIFCILSLLNRRFSSKRSQTDLVWLTLFFGFSTCHFWLSVQGRVWFTALIVGATFHLLFLYFTIGLRKPLLGGLCLGLAFASRATLVFSAIFFAFQLVEARHQLSSRECIKRTTLFVLPSLCIGIALLGMNAQRFDNYFEFGHTYLAGGNLQRIRDFGLFDTGFISRNLSAMFTLMPKILDNSPYLSLSKHGMSVLLSSPALIFLLLTRKPPNLYWHAMTVALIILVPIALYQNTGWEQFSFRFLMDILPLLVVAVGTGTHALTARMKGLIVCGIALNLFGAIIFGRPQFNYLFGDFLPLFSPF